MISLDWDSILTLNSSSLYVKDSVILGPTDIIIIDINKNIIDILTEKNISIGGFMMMPYSSTFVTNNIGIPSAQLPIIYFIAGIFTLIIMPIMGIISDKVDKFKIFKAEVEN